MISAKTFFAVLCCAVLQLVPAVAATTQLVSFGDTWRYRKGTSAPAADWKTAEDATLDATWLSGPGGFGYGDNDDATLLSDMLNGYTTVYIRKEFFLTEGIDSGQTLRVTADWDDAYIVYLDGVELTRSTQAPVGAGTEPPDVEVTARRRGPGRYEIVVRDRGPGIDPVELPRVFDPYFTTRRGGTGLGLAITHNIVQGLGGSIHVSSTVGVGTEVRMEMPIDGPQEAA